MIDIEQMLDASAALAESAGKENWPEWLKVFPSTLEPTKHFEVMIAEWQHCHATFAHLFEDLKGSHENARQQRLDPAEKLLLEMEWPVRVSAAQATQIREYYTHCGRADGNKDGGGPT